MKVMSLVSEDHEWMGADGSLVDGPMFGEECTVVGRDENGDYFLAEYPDDTTDGYDKNWFVEIEPDRDGSVESSKDCKPINVAICQCLETASLSSMSILKTESWS